MKALFTLIAVALMSPIANANGGASVPWPWPWAEECTIDFESLQGTYTVKNSEMVDFIEIKISPLSTVANTRHLKISLYDYDFELLAEGGTFVNSNTRSIYVPMRSLVQMGVPGLKLKIYHRSQKLSCEQKELIPILTVAEQATPGAKESGQMILEPMSAWDEESP